MLDQKDFQKTFLAKMEEQLSRAESLTSIIADYVRASTPQLKKGTVQTLLEKELKNLHDNLLTKGIRVVKRLEEDLPETTIQETPLSFIFRSLFAFVIEAAEPGESISILTRSHPHEQPGEKKPSFPALGIDILIVFRPKDKRNISVLTTDGHIFRDARPAELQVLLARETLFKHGGRMTFFKHRETGKAMIELNLPIERRKVFLYPA